MSKVRFPNRKLHLLFCLFMLLQEKQKLVVFAFCFKMFFCFGFSACSLVLLWITISDWLLCFLFSCCCCFGLFVALVFCYLSNFGYLSKTFLKNWNYEPTQNEMKKTEKRAVWQEQLARVFTRSVFFFFLCVFKFCTLCRKHYKIVALAKNKNDKFPKFRTGPSQS